MCIRSLLPKLDYIKVFLQQTNVDTLVISETWLTNKITKFMITIDGYSVFRCDRPSKSGGVAIYVKNGFTVSVESSVSKSKYFE